MDIFERRLTGTDWPTMIATALLHIEATTSRALRRRDIQGLFKMAGHRSSTELRNRLPLGQKDCVEAEIAALRAKVQTPPASCTDET